MNISIVAPSVKHFALGTTYWRDGYLLGDLMVRRRLPNWIPRKVDLLKFEDTTLGNCFYLSGADFAVDQLAHDIFEPYLRECAEFLPLTTDAPEGPFWIVNIVEIVDCLDYERAAFEERAGVQRVTQYAFRADRLENKLLFRVPEQLTGRVFATEAFRQIVETNRITGLTFMETLGAT